MTKYIKSLPIEKKLSLCIYGIGYLIFGIWISAKITAGFENMGKRLDHLEMRIDQHIQVTKIGV
jgi:hypothetical protein